MCRRKGKMKAMAIQNLGLIFALTLSTGCAGTRTRITPYGSLSKPLRAEATRRLGVVSVVATNTTARLEFRGPQSKSGAVGGAFSDSFSALRMTAGGGTAVVLELIPGEGTVLAEGAVLATAVTVGAVAAVGGTMGGLITGVSPTRTKATEAIFLQVLCEQDVQKEVRDRAVKLMRTNAHAGWTLSEQPLSEGGRAESDPTGQKDQGIDTLVIIEVPRVKVMALRARHSPLLLSVPVNVRLVRTRDGSVLYKGQAEYWGRTARMRDWSLENGRGFRDELKRCGQSLAATVVNDMFSQ